MCSSAAKFKKLEKAIKATWGAIENPQVKIIFYGDNQRTLFKRRMPVYKGNDLVLPCKDGYLNCTEKTLQAFDFVSSNFDFDYIFRTNLGSFVNQDRILNFLMDKPGKQFYSGIVGVYKKGSAHINFASGSGFFLSSDLVRLLVQGRDIVDHRMIDDAAFGEFFAVNDISIDKQAIRLSYTNEDMEYQIGDQTVEFIPEDLLYHIRLRSNDRRIDIERMKTLFALKGGVL